MPGGLTSSGVTAEAVASILGTKLVKNGQMCITVDHVLVPRAQLGTFVELALAHHAAALPGHAASADCCGLISERHLARIEALLDEARAAGTELVSLDPDGSVDREARTVPLVLALDPDPGLRICREEIFGPVLPVIPYDDLDAAIASIDEDARPLGVYVFGDDPEEHERILRGVRSGGVCINGCALQGALPSLGFGGSGASGMGRHHGIEGFREFTNPRGVVVRAGDDHTDVLFPPYGEKARGVIKGVFGG